jgi:hypothetical protein
MMIVAELDEVDYDLEVDGEPVRRTIHRRVWEHGGWATVAIVFAERVRNEEWKPAKLVLIRLQRVHDAWKKHAAITLRADDAVELAAAIDGWRDAFSACG